MKFLRIVAALAVLLPAIVLGSITSQVDKTPAYVVASYPSTLTVTFPFQLSTDLTVLDLGPAGAPYSPAHVLTLGSDYTVAGGGYNTHTNMQTGSITVVSTGTGGVLANDLILIQRNVPINQLTSFQSGGALTAAMIEQALDKQATISQQLNELSGRSLRFQPGETLDGTLLLSARKGAFLAFDVNGNLVFPQSASIIYPSSAPLSVVNIAALRLLPVSNLVTGIPVQVAGYYAANDGGGGTYVWNSTSTATDNGGTVIQATGVTTGRWLLQYSGQLNVKWFGAKGNGSNDDTSAIQATITAAGAIGANVIIPDSTTAYVVSGTLNVSAAIVVQLGAITINSTAALPVFHLAYNASSIMGVAGLGNMPGAGNPGPAGVSIINHSPSAGGTDVITIGTSGDTLSGNQVVGIRVNATANVRDVIRVNANVTNLVVDNNLFTGPGSATYTSGYGINLNGTGSTAGDFIHIAQNALNWLTGGIRQGATNLTSSYIGENQFASISGRGVSMPNGGGQSQIVLNTFIHCNQTTAGAALEMVPSGAFVTDMWVNANSFQANGAAAGTTYDILITGPNARNISIIGNQFNDVVATSGADISVSATQVTGLYVQYNRADQTGGGSGCFGLDATNNPVFYWGNVIDSGTEFVSAAGINNPFYNGNFLHDVASFGIVSSQINGSGQKGVLRGATIQEESTNGTAAIAFSYDGYNNGATQFRSIDIFNGKQSRMAHFDGPTRNLCLDAVPVYANNAAALAGGLTAGYLYRTGADPDTLCIVH